MVYLFSDSPPKDEELTKEELLGEVRRLRALGSSPRDREKLPSTRQGVTRHFTIHAKDGAVDIYATMNSYPDGRPGEIFLTVGQQGELAHGLCEALGTVLSISLQHGVPLAAFTAKFRGTQFQPAGFTKDIEFPTAGSILDLVSRWAESRLPVPT